MVNKIVIVSLNKRFKKLEKLIKKAAQKLISRKNQKNVYLEIYLTDRRFMNKNGMRKGLYEFNVLSFPAVPFFSRPDIRQKNLGEIYLNPEHIAKEPLEIRNWKLEIKEKLVYMLIHGFLHLLGYDHIKKNDRIKMEKEEQRLLKCKIM